MNQLTDQQLTERIRSAINTNARKPDTERQGIVAAMLAAVQPELDRLRAELVTVRSATFREAARVLEATGRDDDSVNLLDKIADGITTHAGCPDPIECDHEAAQGKAEARLATVLAVCDAAEHQAARTWSPQPVPEWVAAVRAAAQPS